jgi:hypothetical protein
LAHQAACIGKCYNSTSRAVSTKSRASGAKPFSCSCPLLPKDFGDDRWAIHYYAAIQGHELVTRRDLIPAEVDHPRAGQWYYKLQLGPLQHKLPPIVSARWRRITFIVTTGDRFMHAAEINDLFEQESPAGRLYVKLRELGLEVEREWMVNEAGEKYTVDLAIPQAGGWLPVTLGERPSPAGGLHFPADAEPVACVREIQAGLHAL